MVKSYLKYELAQTFGVVVSPFANAIWVAHSVSPDGVNRPTGAGRSYVGANEEVLCWDVKKGELLSRWRDKDCTAEVTAIAQSKADQDVFAVGYGDGSIRLWDSRIATVIISFNGHRSAVTMLAFDIEGVRLASGSKDTDIIIWDLVTETGLFKLRGHKDQITGLCFLQPTSRITEYQNGDVDAEDDTITGMDNQNAYLLSTSKDGLIKIWDVSSQYCLETHVTQSNGECWALGMSPDQSGCITAGNDGELKIWTLDIAGLRAFGTMFGEEKTSFLKENGTLLRQGRDRTIGISFHPSADYVAVHGAEKSVEIWRIRSPEEVQKSIARKRKRKREKAGQEKDLSYIEMVNGEDAPPAFDIKEVFRPYVIVRTGGKVRSVDWASSQPGKTLQLLAATTNNQLELYSVSVGERKKLKGDDLPEYSRAYSVELAGHRNDVRATSLSSDDRMLATASSGSLKIWNVNTLSCLRTIECGYALCCSFLPGDKIVIVGNKNGELELFDIASSSLVDTVKAHDDAIWTLQVHPDGQSVVSGSADKSAKFWKFEVFQEEIPGTKRTTPRLKLVHKRSLKVTDDILNVCFSPDSRLLAVATLDLTVKVFFVDTLKLFLSLYGHKLPVLNISISSDSKLIATCSADKNVRLWGLDFGDCHKAFFAHNDSIMQVAFIPHPIEREDGHFFFSVGKDRMLKSWDGDKFEHVQTLLGHHGEIWAMHVSRTGDFVVTASHDKSIRIWRQTDEQLFLEEERERELEEMYDNKLTASLENDQANYDAADGNVDDEMTMPLKQTSTTVTASEKIIEALNICSEDLEVMREYQTQRQLRPTAQHALPQRHPLLSMRNISAESHLLSVFQAIPSSALHNALLLLSFSLLPPLFNFLSIWLEREMNVPLTCRILFFLIKTHHKQIVASRELRLQLQEMRERLRICLEKWKNLLGFNVAATRILSARVADERVKTIEDEEVEREKGRTGQKRGFINVV